jgi:hypothetical protein
MNSQEKLDMPQTSTLEAAFMEGQPWFLPVMLRGDHQVENNGMNQKSFLRIPPFWSFPRHFTQNGVHENMI